MVDAQNEVDAQHISALGPDALDVIFDGLEAGVVICDRSRHLTLINQVARRLLLPQDAIALDLSDLSDLSHLVKLYEPGDRTPLAADELPLWRALSGDESHDVELVIVHPEGDRYMVLASSRPLRGPGSEVQGATMTLYDITQRYRAETELRSHNQGLKTEARQRLEDLQAANETLRQESAQRRQAELALQQHRDYLQTIFDTEPECVQVLTAAGRLQFINAAGLALLGVPTPAALLGRLMVETVAAEWQTTFLAFHQSVCGGHRGTLEFELVNHRGDRRWVETHASPLTDTATGEVLHLAILRDITERRQAEQALRESEHLFSTIANASPALVWMAGTDGQCVYFNQPWLAFRGRHLADEVGDGWQEGIHSDDYTRCLDDYTTAFAARRPFAMEYRLRRHDGEYRWILDNGIPRYATNDQFLGYIGTCVDISDRRQAEDKLQRYARRLQGLHAMDRAILAQFEPEGVARSALGLLCQLLECQQGIVTLYDRTAQQGEVIADNSSNALFLAGMRLPLADFAFAQTARRWRMRRIRSIARLKHPPLIFQRFLATNLQSAMTAPLEVNGRVIGEVTLADPSLNHFQPDHEEVVQEVTDHLAIALQNARLFEQVAADRQRLKDLSSQLLEAQETERRSLAQELHDEIGQALTAVKLNLHRLERLVDDQGKPVLDDCLSIADGALQQVRNLSLNLRPSMLDDLGLLPALRWYVSRHAERTGLLERFTCDQSLPPLPPQVETACFRIVQESLTNIARHAQAKAVTVTLAVVDQCLHLCITDDGLGFNADASRAQAHGTSLGLLGMQERALLIGGQLYLTSQPGQGTSVDMWVPLGPE